VNLVRHGVAKNMRSADRFTRYSRQIGGQSLVEFALLLPLFVLLIVGIFDLGRAFFAYIAISNAAREGTRVYTFDPDNTRVSDVYYAIDAEIGTSTVVDSGNITKEIHCVDPVSNTQILVINDIQLKACKSEAPIMVIVRYTHEMILSFFFPSGLTLVRSAQMMVP
jgi:hypothetical protein